MKMTFLYSDDGQFPVYRHRILLVKFLSCTQWSFQ